MLDKLYNLSNLQLQIYKIISKVSLSCPIYLEKRGTKASKLRSIISYEL